MKLNKKYLITKILISTELLNPIRKTRVLNLVFITIPCLMFWARGITKPILLKHWSKAFRKGNLLQFQMPLFYSPFILMRTVFDAPVLQSLYLYAYSFICPCAIVSLSLCVQFQMSLCYSPFIFMRTVLDVPVMQSLYLNAYNFRCPCAQSLYLNSYSFRCPCAIVLLS